MAKMAKMDSILFNHIQILLQNPPTTNTPSMRLNALFWSTREVTEQEATQDSMRDTPSGVRQHTQGSRDREDAPEGSREPGVVLEASERARERERKVLLDITRRETFGQLSVRWRVD